MPPSTDSPDEPVVRGLWRLRALAPDGGTAWAAHVNSTRHPDGTVVELPVAEALAAVGDAALAIAHVDDDGRVARLELTERGLGQAPPLWFAELPALDAAPPTDVLIAFSGHGVEPGSLVDRDALGDTGVVSDDQVGAIQWYPLTGEVDQIYVSPAWRRRGIAGAIISTTSALAFARGWERLWGDGQRTAEGDRLAKASVSSHRFAPLTHLSPPMTPFDERID